MTTGQREAAVTALLALITAAYPWKTPPQRKLVLWSNPAAAPALRPMAFLFEGGTETHTWSNNAIEKRDIMVRVFVYIDVRGQDANGKPIIGATVLNTIADALDAALKPTGADIPLGRNTLGGTAYSCRIEGGALKDPGDIDGDGIMTIPVRITLP